MIEKKVIALKKDELSIIEFIKKTLGKGKISKVRIEYTPIGEKIIISTNKPGLVIGRRGERIYPPCLRGSVVNRSRSRNPVTLKASH